jgi:hypothetical protein
MIKRIKNRWERRKLLKNLYKTKRRIESDYGNNLVAIAYRPAGTEEEWKAKKRAIDFLGESYKNQIAEIDRKIEEAEG